MNNNGLSKSNSVIVCPPASVLEEEHSTSSTAKKCIADEIPLSSTLTASTSVQKRAYCSTTFMSVPSKIHLPHFAGYDLSCSSIFEHSHEKKKSRLVNPTSLVPLLRFDHKLVRSHPQIDCVNLFSAGNQVNVTPSINYTHQNIRSRFMADKPDQYVQAFCSSTKPYVSSSNFSGNSELSSNVPWRPESFPLDYICGENLFNTSFSSSVGLTKPTKTPETSTIVVSKLPESVDVIFPNPNATQRSSSECNSYASVSAHTSCSEIVQVSGSYPLPFTHSSTNSSKDSKNVSQVEEETQNNLKTTVFKHEPRKRKSQNHTSTVMVEVNTTDHTNPSFFHSNNNNNIITKCDAKSTLNSVQEHQSSSCATTVLTQLTHSLGFTPSTICEQLSYPFSHGVITHAASSVLSRPQCTTNHAPRSSNAVRRSMGTSRRPILPNHLRKYPNTLLLNTRLGFKSVCNTAAIQSIHHIRSDIKPIPYHDRPPFTQYHRQNVSSTIYESSSRKQKVTSICENKPPILNSFIIASKPGSVVTSTNTSVITPSFKIDVLPNYVTANLIPTNLTYMNTVYYSSPEEDFLWKSQFFGKKNAQQLIYTLIYLFAKLLHLRNSHQLHQLRFGLNSQLKVVYFNDNNDDEINNNQIKPDTSHLTLKDDPIMSSNKCINDKNGNSGLIYRPDSSCSLLAKSITSMSSSSSLSSPIPRTTVTNVSDQNIHSYFDYLDGNTPRDYTVKQNVKLQNKISRYSSILLPRSGTNEQQLLTTTSSGINFIFDHNSLNNHERCIVCYHEFYVSKRLSSIGQSLKNNYFLTWQTNCSTKNSWFNCRPTGPDLLATILRKIESTLAYTAVQIKQRRQSKINSLSNEVGSNQNLIIKSTSSRLSSVKNNLQSNYHLQIKQLNSCYSASGNSPLNLVTKKHKNQNGADVNDWIFKTSGCKQSNFQDNVVAHPTCLDYWPELTERARQSPWQCSDCKTCTVCNSSEYKSDLIICDACDKGFHIECHRPKLEESIDRSLPWVCANCQDEGYRVAIGTLPSSINNQNYLSPNKTEECNDDLMKTPLKEINSSYEYIKTESKQEIDESGMEENVIKSVESSPHSTVGQNFTTTTSTTICKENFPADINSTDHSSIALTPTKSCYSTSPKLNESNNSNNNSTTISTNNNNSTTCEINSVQLDSDCLHENKSSISIQDAADNDNKTSPILSNSTSDLHLKSCLEDNNNNNTSNIKEIKNEIENTSESNIIINGENQEISSNTNRPTDVSMWSVDHVQQWLLEEGFPREAEAFYQQEIDGTCLLLMKRMDVLTELGIKLGPAVKIYERIKRFQSQCGSPT